MNAQRWWKLLNIFVALSIISGVVYIGYGLYQHYLIVEQEKRYIVPYTTNYKEYKSYRVGSHK